MNARSILESPGLAFSILVVGMVLLAFMAWDKPDLPSGPAYIVTCVEVTKQEIQKFLTHNFSAPQCLFIPFPAHCIRWELRKNATTFHCVVWS